MYICTNIILKNINMIPLMNNLKIKRFNKNQLTQEELSKHINVSRQTIQAIESGRFNPSTKLALTLAEFFDCSVEDIFYLKKGDE